MAVLVQQSQLCRGGGGDSGDGGLKSGVDSGLGPSLDEIEFRDSVCCCFPALAALAALTLSEIGGSLGSESRRECMRHTAISNGGSRSCVPSPVPAGRL